MPCVSDTVHNILIWGAERVGDVVMTFPALKLLRQHCPDAHVTYVTTEYARQVVEISGMVDTIHALRFKNRMKSFFAYRRLRKMVKAGAFDRIFVFGKVTRYQKHVGPLTDVFRSETIPAEHYAEQHARIVMSGLGLSECAIPTPLLELPDSAQDEARLTALGLDIHKSRYVVFHPGTNRIMRRAQTAKGGRKGVPERHWPLSHFANLAQMIFSDFPKTQVALVGTANEGKWIAEEFARNPGNSQNIINLCGWTDMPSLLQVLKHAEALVCTDSGVMHLATVVGTPIIALFGPSNENRTGAFGMGERFYVLRAVSLEEAQTNPDCMSKIPANRVFANLVPHLASTT